VRGLGDDAEGGEVKIELSWPPYVLWPNKKANWRAKSAASRAARDEAYVETKNALYGREFVDPGGVIVLTVTGHKPAERGQDRDGLSSALKPAYDGIASALNVNDKHFKHVVDWGENCPPRGRVVVEIP
jgi:crossover junction endodeoxyribonuclease RusA